MWKQKQRKIFRQVPVENPSPGENAFRNADLEQAFLKKFMQTLESKTEIKFKVNCAGLAPMNSVMAEYLTRHWWCYKERLVSCWTDRYKHFGFRDTSVVEGTHAQVKVQLPNRNIDLVTLFQCVLPWWLREVKRISYRIEFSCVYVMNDFQSDLYSAVVRVISAFALGLVRDMIPVRTDTPVVPVELMNNQESTALHQLFSLH